jgi:hypothetical protein
MLGQAVPAYDAAGDSHLSQAQASQNATAEDASAAGVQRDRPPDVAALDGSGTIPFSMARHPQFLVGGTVAGGFDSNPLNLGAGGGTASYSFSPYIGLQSGGGRTQLIMQYHPTISRFTDYAGQTMHLASAKMAGSLSPRLDWTFGVLGNHGNDSLRLLGDHSTTVDGVPVSGAGSASFLPNAGDVTNVEAAIDLRYAGSPRSSIGLHFSDSYNSTPYLHHKGSVAGVDANYTRALGPTFSVLAYAQYANYYGDLNCIAVGSGVGVHWQPQESTAISVRGGPEIDSPGCKSQQGFAYNTSVTRKLPWKSQFYVTADRQPVISFLGSGLWQDDVSAGYERTFQTANTLSFDAGYLNSSTLVDTSSYRGSFFDSSYVREIHKGFSLRCSYRRFSGRTGETDIHRNVLQFAMTFTPNTRMPSQ